MTSISAAELSRWTPVALDLSAPTPWIEWGDFGDLRFTEPFFDETVSRWAGGNPPPVLVRTDLDALVALDQAPSLDPSGLIFHLSRCGSTLLSRVLRQVPGCVVLSEPALVNHVLLADPETIDEETRARLLRLLIRALGRRRHGDERHVIVKLSSWNVRRIGLFRRAFPSARIVWLQRRPAEVVMSLLADPPEWGQRRSDADETAALFDLAHDAVASLDPAAFYAQALAALLRGAHGAGETPILTVDYANLPDAAWTAVAPFLGLCPDPADIERMAQEARFYSKDSTPRIFNLDATAHASVPAVVELATAHLDDLYSALGGRGAPRSS
ncbi:MAG: sulfotransferase [Proteobacteria bacterium]|nr:sulfotransferase [Pseudomonadota bacterium]